MCASTHLSILIVSTCVCLSSHSSLFNMRVRQRCCLIFHGTESHDTRDKKHCPINYSLLIFSTGTVFAVGGWDCSLMPITVQTKKEARSTFEQACSDLRIKHKEFTVQTNLIRFLSFRMLLVSSFGFSLLEKTPFFKGYLGYPYMASCFKL